MMFLGLLPSGHKVSRSGVQFENRDYEVKWLSSIGGGIANKDGVPNVT